MDSTIDRIEDIPNTGAPVFIDDSKLYHGVSAGGIKLKGHPIQVVTTTNEHSFELDEEALSKVLLDPRTKDRQVVVVSVAGAFRKGKSFLLDFFLRYLNAQVRTKNGEDTDEDWLGDDTSPLEGFPWRGGAERDTTGILLWSEPFPITLPDGRNVVILLMDTQGAFDSESTVKDCATVFALSTMLSSVQVFNISSNIQEDDLQHLQLFTEYGRLALQDNGSKPFQILQFLVRDWSYPYQYEYGQAGGEILLQKRLTINEKQHKELQQLRVHIRTCFTKLSCFLMPHPGLKVATNPYFDGKLKDIEPDFLTNLRELVPLILSKDSLVVKEINGQKVTAMELLEYFKAYIKIYQGDELPEPKSMLQATAEANNLAAVANAKDIYRKSMEEMCGGDKPYLSPEHLEREHIRCKNTSIETFKCARKMGGSEFSESFAEQLDNELEEQFENLSKHNESKNLFAAARTPGVLITIMVICYVVSGILGIIGLEGLANIINLVLGLCLIMLCTWLYVRYSGEFREVAHHIDTFCTTAWEMAIGPLLQQFLQGSATNAVRVKVNGKDK